MGELLFAVGGIFTDGAPGEVYHHANDSWTTIPPLLTSRSCTAAASLNGLLYVAGSSDTHPNPQTLKSCESYDPETRIWMPAPPMRKGRYGHGLLAWAARLGRQTLRNRRLCGGDL